MARAGRIFFCFLLLTVSTEALKLPDYIKPCSRNDPKFDDCALKNGREALPRIVKGDRKLAVPLLDPLFVEKLSMTHSGMQATSINFTIVGMKDAELENFSADFDRQVIKLSFKVPRVTLSGWYDVRGKILGMPMYGHGDYKMVFNELRGKYSTNYTLTELADGEQYALPDAYEVEYDMDEMKVNFGNLFNGNKLLGDSLNNLINQNWRIVIEDLGKPVFTALGSIVHQILKAVSQKVPYNELFTK